MEDYELFLIDAEYWAGCLTALELSQTIEPYIARISYIENIFGVHRDNDDKWRDDDGEAFTKAKGDHRCFFSLMIAECLRRVD